MALLKYILKKNADALAGTHRNQYHCLCAWDHVAGGSGRQVLNPNGNESYTQAEYDAMAAKMGLDQPAVVSISLGRRSGARDLGRSFHE